MLLRPVQALCLDVPVFSAQSAHQPKGSRIVAQRGIEGMHPVVVDEAVEEVLLFRSIIAVPRLVVRPAFLR